VGLGSELEVLRKQFLLSSQNLLFMVDTFCLIPQV
jgi:hypothetical protein